MRRALFYALLLGTGLLRVGAARAQGRAVVRFEDEVIRGKVQKPEITVIITRQNLNSTYKLELRESFIPKIVESVEDDPF